MAEQSSSSSQSTSSQEPYAPEFIPKAGATIEEYKKGAYDAKTAQLERLNQYVQHLHQLRSLAVKQARGAGARAGGQQNPLAVYQALNQMASEAGVPMDAEIGKALQNSNSIENTLNSLIAKAGDAQIALANISKQQSQSTSQSQSGGGGGGGSGANAGGRGRGGQGGGDQGGGYIDIRGQRWGDRPTNAASAARYGAEGRMGSSLDRISERLKNDAAGRGYVTNEEYARQNPQGAAGQPTGSSLNAGNQAAMGGQGFGLQFSPQGQPDMGAPVSQEFNPFSEQSQMSQASQMGNAGFQPGLSDWGKQWDTLSLQLPGASNFGIGGDNFNSSHLNVDVPQWQQGEGMGGGPSYSQYGEGGFEPVNNNYGQFPQTSLWDAATDWNAGANYGADLIGKAWDTQGDPWSTYSY